MSEGNWHSESGRASANNLGDRNGRRCYSNDPPHLILMHMDCGSRLPGLKDFRDSVPTTVSATILGIAVSHTSSARIVIDAPLPLRPFR